MVASVVKLFSTDVWPVGTPPLGSFVLSANLVAQDPNVQSLFDYMGQFWPPRQPSQSNLEDDSVGDDAEGQAEHDCDEQQALEDDMESDQFEESDEALAVRMGGMLRSQQTPSPSPAKPAPTSQPERGDHDGTPLEIHEIDEQIALLQRLNLKKKKKAFAGSLY